MEQIIKIHFKFMEVLKFCSCMTTWPSFTEQERVLAGNLLISKILPRFVTF